MELNAGSQPALEQIERMQGADLVVGLLRAEAANGGGPAAAAIVREALAKFTSSPRAVLVMDDNSGAEAARDESPVSILPCHLLDATVPLATPQSVFGAYQTIFGIGRKIGARACMVIASEMQSITPFWIDRLARPALEMDYDLVAPRYARHRWEGLINRAILSPLNRALYGKRVQNPLGPDFGLSGRLTASVLEDQPAPRGTGAGHSMVSIVSVAARGSFQVCEAYLGARLQPPADFVNLGSLLAQVLGPVFAEVERNVILWQRVRGSLAVPVFGTPEAPPEESGPVDAGRLIESFQLGVTNLLQDLWSLVLPPKTLLEIRKLSRLPLAQFRMPDDVWASIVYDFALAHRVRTINRDHLLRSFTPLYLGWIASYGLEMAAADLPEVEARLERLARAYEAGKPYLVSRWRWPDRFNP
jgi:glucosylglycerate synthase